MDMNKSERENKRRHKVAKCCRKLRQAEEKAYYDPDNGKAGVWRTPIFLNDIAHWNKTVRFVSDKWLKFIIQYDGETELLRLQPLRDAVLAEIASRTLLEDL